MTNVPAYGQRSDPNAAPTCSRHPHARSIDYCKRCRRPTCIECTIPTEVASICVDCAGRKRPTVKPGTPIVTYGIIAICVVLFLVSLVSDSAWQAMTFTPQIGYIQPWRFLTTAFLHSGIGHLLFNMLALYFVGCAIEQALGKWRYIYLYVMGAVGGTLAVLMWVLVDPGSASTQTVGASGAVFGLFAAVFVLQRRAGLDSRSVLVLLGINLVYGFIVPNVSWQAHLGGLLTGLALTWALSALDRPRPGMTAAVQERRSILAALGMAVALVALVALTFRVIIEVHG